MAELYLTNLINDANLISYWRLAGNSNDSKGSNHGTDTNVTYGTQYGKYGQGAHFAGNSKIVLPKPAFTNAQLAGGGSYNLWVRVNGNPAELKSFFDSEAEVIVKLNTDGTIRFWTGSPYSTAHGTGTVTDNQWHMITMTWSGGTASLYIDTNLDKANASSAPNIDVLDRYTSMGRESGNDMEFLVGDLDEVSVWSKVLSAGEMATLYGNSVVSPFPSSLR